VTACWNMRCYTYKARLIRPQRLLAWMCGGCWISCAPRGIGYQDSLDGSASYRKKGFPEVEQLWRVQPS
jgi:hypothetical protein